MRPILFFLVIVNSLFNHSYAQWQLLTAPNSSCIVDIVASESVIYAAAGKGLVRSWNGGTSWESLTIPFIGISSIAANGSTVYIGSSGFEGIAYSTNYGSSWTVINDGLPGGYGKPQISCLSQNDTCVFAGTYIKGMFMLKKPETNWVALNEGFPFPYLCSINDIAFGDTNIYAGTDCSFYRYSKSLKKWIQKSTGIGSDIDITSLAVTNSQVYAGTFGDGIYLSSDKGETWSPINEGLDIGILSGAGVYIQSIIANDNRVFVGTGVEYEHFYGGNGIYRYLKNENRWEEWNTGLEIHHHDPWSYYDMVIALEATNDKLFAGTFDIWISSSGGLFSRPLSVLNGIKNIASTVQLNIYPNPTATILTIDLSTLGSKKKSIQVYNAYGMKVLENQSADDQIIVSVEALPTGLYIVKLNMESSILYCKFYKL